MLSAVVILRLGYVARGGLSSFSRKVMVKTPKVLKQSNVFWGQEPTLCLNISPMESAGADVRRGCGQRVGPLCGACGCH